MSESIYTFVAKNIKGDDVSLKAYENKVMLIVNVASKCGFTGQYTGLEKLYQDHKDQGLVILGFPCNQFRKQEPGSAEEIQEFCKLNYGVSFDLFEKIDVNGDNAHPLYKYLQKTKPGLLGTEKIKWNFTKFLVDRNGKIVSRYGSQIEPKDIDKDIKKLL